jgi:hypothetical protein
MASFADILSKISTAAQIAQTVTPAIELFGKDHLASTQEILQIAGAGVSVFNGDPQVQAEAAAAAALASTLAPLAFQLIGLFHKKKTA